MHGTAASTPVATRIYRDFKRFVYIDTSVLADIGIGGVGTTCRRANMPIRSIQRYLAEARSAQIWLHAMRDSVHS